MVDEVECSVVCPVQVLKDKNGRPEFAEGLEETAPRRERLRAPLSRHCHVVAMAEESLQVPDDPVQILDPHSLRRVSQLGFDLRWRIALEDARLGLHDLRDWPEAHPLAVGERSPLPPRD